MKKKELFLRNLIAIQLKSKSFLFLDLIERKKLPSTTKDENEPYREMLFRFDNKKFDFRMIINWIVTGKSYSICGENEKTDFNVTNENNKHLTNRY